jgi:CHAD domain-containing protein
VAYRLRRDESISTGLRRLAKKEIKNASTELRRADPPSDDAIHEARKGVKKVRALFRLVKADRGEGLGNGRKRLRAVNHALSQLRDADAMLEVLDRMRNKGGRLFDERAFARVHRRLSAHKREVLHAARHGNVWPDVVKQLHKIRRGAKQWRPTHRGFRALGEGIRLSHLRGRKAMIRARRTGRAKDFHEWRKEMKALWYELRLLEECSAGIKHDVALLHRAETWLGDEHNLVVFCAEVSRDASICNGMVDLGRLQQTVNRYQCDLRKKAIASAGTIYRRKSDSYVRAMKRAWNTWRQQARRTSV